MKWIVEGAAEHTGQDVKIAVDATDEKAAAVAARQRGVLPTRVYAAADAPPPVAARHVPPPTPPARARVDEGIIRTAAWVRIGASALVVFGVLCVLIGVVSVVVGLVDAPSNATASQQFGIAVERAGGVVVGIFTIAFASLARLAAFVALLIRDAAQSRQ